MSSRQPDEFSGTPYYDNYSPDLIYRKVGDLDHAKSVRGIWGNVTTNSVLRQRVNKVVSELGKDLYRSVADLERDSLEHRCAYWEAQLKLSDPTCRELRLSRLEGSLRSLVEADDHLETFYNYLYDKFRNSRSSETRLMLKLETEQYIESLSDPYWQERFQSLIS